MKYFYSELLKPYHKLLFHFFFFADITWVILVDSFFEETKFLNFSA